MRNAAVSEINDVFDRINTKRHRLSDQERRQAGVENDFSAMVREIACTLRAMHRWTRLSFTKCLLSASTCR